MEETQATMYWIKQKLETKTESGGRVEGSWVQKCRNGQRYLALLGLGSDVQKRCLRGLTG